jgi:hypothetical protein
MILFPNDRNILSFFFVFLHSKFILYMLMHFEIRKNKNIQSRTCMHEIKYVYYRSISNQKQFDVD